MTTVQKRKLTVEWLLLQREIEEFFYHEADLLDDRHYETWLDMLTDDIRYFMPMARNFKFGEEDQEWTRELQDVAWFDEGKITLRQRVQQIMTGVHWAEEPQSRASHLITNVEILDVNGDPENATEIVTRCRWLLYRNRLQTETDIMVGKRKDVLRKIDGEWKVARREIYLDQNVLLPKNLTLFF